MAKNNSLFKIIFEKRIQLRCFPVKFVKLRIPYWKIISGNFFCKGDKGLICNYSSINYFPVISSTQSH